MAEDSKAEFDAFVKAQQKSAEENSVDWNRLRDEWLVHLGGLYRKIEELLGTYIEANQILRRYEDVRLNEEGIGTYTARRLIIKIGGKEIVLEPIGTLLIGTKGRVDVTGPAGSTRFVLVDKDATARRIRVSVEPPDKPVEWAWKIVTSPPTIRYIDLAQDTLFRALIEVAGD